MNKAVLSLEEVRKIGNRTVVKILNLGDGFVGFIMNSVEDGES